MVWKYYLEGGSSIEFDLAKMSNELSQYSDPELDALKEAGIFMYDGKTDLRIDNKVIEKYRALSSDNQFSLIADSIFIKHQINPRLRLESDYSINEMISFIDNVLNMMLSKTINHYCIWQKGRLMIASGNVTEGINQMEQVIGKTYSEFERQKLKKELASIAFEQELYGIAAKSLRQVDKLSVIEEQKLWQSYLNIGYEEEADKLYEDIYLRADLKNKKKIKDCQYSYDLSKLKLEEISYISGMKRVTVSAILKNTTFKTYSDIVLELWFEGDGGEVVKKRELISVLYPGKSKSINSFIENADNSSPVFASGKIISFSKAVKE